MRLDASRWRAHLDIVDRQYPGLIPVIKGDGYGFGARVLLAEARRLGVSAIAVGTVAEARVALALFPGYVHVLSPYVRSADLVDLPGRVVIRTATLESISPTGRAQVIELRGSMQNLGLRSDDLPALAKASQVTRIRRLLSASATRRPESSGCGPGGCWLDRPSSVRRPSRRYVLHQSPPPVRAGRTCPRVRRHHLPTVGGHGPVARPSVRTVNRINRPGCRLDAAGPTFRLPTRKSCPRGLCPHRGRRHPARRGAHRAPGSGPPETRSDGAVRGPGHRWAQLVPVSTGWPATLVR